MSGSYLNKPSICHWVDSRVAPLDRAGLHPADWHGMRPAQTYARSVSKQGMRALRGWCAGAWRGAQCTPRRRTTASPLPSQAARSMSCTRRCGPSPPPSGGCFQNPADLHSNSSSVEFWILNARPRTLNPKPPTFPNPHRCRAKRHRHKDFQFFPLKYWS